MTRKGTQLWMEIDQNGKITFVDWDAAELMAERLRKARRPGGWLMQMDDHTMALVATVAVSIREYVLNTTIPATKGDRVKS